MQKDKQAKANAAKDKIVAQVTTTSVTVQEIPAAQRFWQIKGTEYYARNKQELKKLRAALNLKAGFNESLVEEVKHDDNDNETVVGKIAAAPAKDWPFKITKGPAHPARNPAFGTLKAGTKLTHGGQGFTKVGFDQALRHEDGIKVYFGPEVQIQASTLSA